MPHFPPGPPQLVGGDRDQRNVVSISVIDSIAMTLTATPGLRGDLSGGSSPTAYVAPDVDHVASADQQTEGDEGKHAGERVSAIMSAEARA